VVIRLVPGNGDIRGAWSGGAGIREVLDQTVDGTGGRGQIEPKFPKF